MDAFEDFHFHSRYFHAEDEDGGGPGTVLPRYLSPDPGGVGHSEHLGLGDADAEDIEIDMDGVDEWADHEDESLENWGLSDGYGSESLSEGDISMPVADQSSGLDGKSRVRSHRDIRCSMIISFLQLRSFTLEITGSLLQRPAVVKANPNDSAGHFPSRGFFILAMFMSILYICISNFITLVSLLSGSPPYSMYSFTSIYQSEMSFNIPATAFPSLVSFHTPVNLPLHFVPFPPPLTPTLALIVSPASLTFFSSFPKVMTMVVLVAVCIEGEDVRTMRYEDGPVSADETSLTNAVDIADKKPRGLLASSVRCW